MAEYRVRTERTDPTVAPVVTPAAAAAAQQHVGGDDFTGDEPHLPHKPADDTEQIYFEGSPQLRAEIGRGIFWILLGILLIALPAAAALRHWDEHAIHRRLPWWLF